MASFTARGTAASPGARAESEPSREASVDVSQLGGVTWVDARLDWPLPFGLAVFPQGALLHVAPRGGINDEEWHAYAGGGVAWEPGGSWHLEMAAMVAPPADDIESQAGELEVERDFGRDDERDTATLELRVVLSVQHVRWEDGNGPAGRHLVQAYLDAAPVWHPTLRWDVRPRAMLFAYDHRLDGATGDRLGSVAVLAEVGSLAPLVTAGASVGYSFVRWCTPSISANEIVYAGGAGTATEAMLGLRVRVTRSWTASIAGGALWNRVHGPLVPSDLPSWLPDGQLELSLSF